MPVYEYIKKNKTYYYYAFEVKDEFGKRKTIKKRGFKGSREASKAEIEAKVAWNNDNYMPENKQLYRDYVLRWLDNRQNLSEDSKYYYKIHLKNYIIPLMGNIHLSNITASTIENVLSKLNQTDISDQYKKIIYNLINASLNAAVKKQLINSNPVKLVDSPRVEKKEMNYWSKEEVIQFLNGFEHRYKIVFMIAIYTGMRIGEILGLRISDINLESKIIAIRQILISRNKRLKVGAKTKSGNRSVAIPTFICEEIKKHIELIKNEKEKANNKYQDNGLLICTTKGTPVDDSYMRKMFLNFIKKSKVRIIRIHDLRHTCASLLLSSGIHPKIVQELLGHSTISTTLDQYSHIMPNLQSEAIEGLDKILREDK